MFIKINMFIKKSNKQEKHKKPTYMTTEVQIPITMFRPLAFFLSWEELMAT